MCGIAAFADGVLTLVECHHGFVLADEYSRSAGRVKDFRNVTLMASLTGLERGDILELEVLMRLGSLRVEGSKFRLPCVYELIAETGERLYVGFSSRGFSRAFNSNGNDGRSHAFLEAPVIRITVFDSVAEAASEEQRLIRLYRPKYNIAGLPEKTRATGGRIPLFHKGERVS